jgi:hypothetical protein
METSSYHSRKTGLVCDWTAVCRIAHNTHKCPLLLLTAARRPLLVIPPRRPVAGASCARKFRVDIRTSYRHPRPEGLAGPRACVGAAGCFAWSILQALCMTEISIHIHIHIHM